MYSNWLFCLSICFHVCLCCDTYEVSVSKWSGSCSKSPAKSTSDSMADPSNSVRTVESKPGEDSLQSGMQSNTAATVLMAVGPPPGYSLPTVLLLQPFLSPEAGHLPLLEFWLVSPLTTRTYIFHPIPRPR